MEALVCFAFLENLPLSFFFKESLQCKILKSKLYHCFSPKKKKEKKNIIKPFFVVAKMLSHIGLRKARTSHKALWIENIIPHRL